MHFVGEKHFVITNELYKFWDDQILYHAQNSNGWHARNNKTFPAEFVFFKIDDNEWSYYTFLTCHHDFRNCNNDKILYLVKR
jgi:hypothetical protein